MTEPTQQILFRPMCIDDLAQIVAIEKDATPSPWSAKQFQQSLEQDHCVVICDAHSIVGYAILSMVMDQAEVLNICISPEYQGGGFGSQLLTGVLTQLSDEIEIVYLEVRVSNFRAIHLYLNQGFVEVGQRRGYYPTEFGREDAILMNLLRRRV